MTVCIAAICKWQNAEMIVGATDRMLTAGDIEFEPPQRKVFHFGQQTVILWAGDAAVQMEICRDAYVEIMPQTLPVSTVAEVYARHFAAYRRKQAERRLLYPIGLDFGKFHQEQKTMSPEFVDRIATAAQQSELDAEAIVAGVDATGAHIYQVSDPGDLALHDGIGFASVGIGSKHAESQFMFSRYAREWPFERALYLVYSAKRRAETAPGVGLETDMFFIGPYPGPWTPVLREMFNMLKQIYTDVTVKAREAEESGHKAFETFVKEQLEKAKQSQQQADTKPKEQT